MVQPPHIFESTRDEFLIHFPATAGNRRWRAELSCCCPASPGWRA